MAKQFGDYIIIEEIARGGMGIVYKVAHKNSKKLFALKVLLTGASANESEIKRFFREAQASAKLNHNNIVKVQSFGEQDGYYYFSMDYIEGETLQDYIDRKEPIRKLMKIISIVAKALYAAHKEGIIHRDIKPSNILIDKITGEPYITDFGLAKRIDETTVLTQTGTALGTPFYMPPEQIHGAKDVDWLADIYSLGIVMYQCLTGVLPFNSDSLADLYKRILDDEPILPKNLARVPVQLEEICLKAIEKNKKYRYQSSLDLAKDIDFYLKRRRVGRGTTTSNKLNWNRTVRKYKKHFNKIFFISAALLLIFSVFLWFIISFNQNNKNILDKAKTLSLKAEQSLEENKFEEALDFYNKSLELNLEFWEAYA